VHVLGSTKVQRSEAWDLPPPISHQLWPYSHLRIALNENNVYLTNNSLLNYLAQQIDNDARNAKDHGTSIIAILVHGLRQKEHLRCGRIRANLFRVLGAIRHRPHQGFWYQAICSAILVRINDSLEDPNNGVSHENCYL